MSRSLLIVTKTEIKRYTLGKDTRPMTTVRKRLYRTDERLMLHNVAGEDEIIIYDVDSTQPYGSGKEYLDPDETMDLIDIGKRARTKNVSHLSGINARPEWIIYGIVGILVVFSLLSGGIV
jgi:hypothetical protein